jgi:hypothetical protein
MSVHMRVCVSFGACSVFCKKKFINKIKTTNPHTYVLVLGLFNITFIHLECQKKNIFI